MNELEAYLDSLGLEGEDRTQLAAILAKNDKYKTNAITSHRERLAHSDYTKKTQDLAKERERLAAEQAEMNKQLTKLNKDLENGSITAAKYKAKLEAINREWGDTVIDLKDLEAAPVVVNHDPKPGTVDDPAFLRRLDQAERASMISPQVAAVMMDLRAEYQDVFGSGNGFSAEKLLAYAREKKIPIRSERDPETGELLGGPGAFERLYKVPQKRDEIRIKTITEKAVADAKAEMQQNLDKALAGNATGDRNPNNWNTGSHLLGGDFKQNQANRIAAAAKEAGREASAPPSQGRSAAESELGGGGSAFARAYLERRAKGIGFGQEGKAA